MIAGWRGQSRGTRPAPLALPPPPTALLLGDGAAMEWWWRGPGLAPTIPPHPGHHGGTVPLPSFLIAIL